MIIGPGWQPISPTVLIITGLFNYIDKFFPGINKVYSPGLNFDEGLVDMREAKTKTATPAKPQKPKDLPILLWSRSTLKVDRPYEDRNQRDVFYSGDDPDKVEIIAGAISVLPIEFMLVANKMSDIEIAELVYMTKIRGVSQYDVDYDKYGMVSYNVNWNDISNFNSNSQNESYLSINFDCEVIGPWLLFAKTYPRLKQIISTAHFNLYRESSISML